jgi:hypothetical protein
VPAEQALPVFLAADELDAMIEATDDDVLRFWSQQDL